MHPVQRALPSGQAWTQSANQIRIRGYAETNAVHDTREVLVRSGQDVHVGSHAGLNALQLRFAEVADGPPDPRIDQSEYLLALVDVRSFRNRQIVTQCL